MDKKKIIGIITIIINIFTFLSTLISLIFFFIANNSDAYYEFFIINFISLISLAITTGFSIFITSLQYYKQSNQFYEESWVTRNEKVFILIYLLFTGASIMAGIGHALFYSVSTRMDVNEPASILIVSAVRLAFSVGIMESVFSMVNIVNGFVVILSSNYQRVV